MDMNTMNGVASSQSHGVIPFHFKTKTIRSELGEWTIEGKKKKKKTGTRYELRDSTGWSMELKNWALKLHPTAWQKHLPSLKEFEYRANWNGKEKKNCTAFLIHHASTFNGPHGNGISRNIKMNEQTERATAKETNEKKEWAPCLMSHTNFFQGCKWWAILILIFIHFIFQHFSLANQK